MAKGRRATPKKILEKRGSWRAKTKKDDPEPILGHPEMPTWVQGKAAKEWDRIMPLLMELGTATRIDYNALGRYCMLLAKFIDSEEMSRMYMEQHTIKDTAKDPDDMKQLANYLRANNSLADQLLKLESHFGLTPSARASLHTVTKDDAKDAGDGKPELVRRPG